MEEIAEKNRVKGGLKRSEKAKNVFL